MWIKIKRLLEENKISPYQLSKKINITATSFTDWKKGKASPSAKALQKIAEYFKIPVSYFYEIDNENNENQELKNTSKLEVEKEDELTKEALSLWKELSNEDKRQVLNYAKFISQQKK